MKYIVMSVIIMLSIVDLKYKKISIVGPLILTCLGIFSMVVGKSYIFHLLGLIPGVITIIISCISRESIGMGDGLVIGSLGFCIGLINIINVILIGCFGLFLLAFVMVFIKGRRNLKVAFIPFLLVGYVGGMILEKI